MSVSQASQGERHGIRDAWMIRKVTTMHEENARKLDILQSNQTNGEQHHPRKLRAPFDGGHTSPYGTLRHVCSLLCVMGHAGAKVLRRTNTEKLGGNSKEGSVGNARRPEWVSRYSFIMTRDNKAINRMED